jgi:hypothetical protein
MAPTSDSEERQMHFRTTRLLVRIVLLLLVAGCDARDAVLPDPGEVEAWFGDAAEVTLQGNRLVITGEMDPEHLRRGGAIWQRATPYFFLLNVHVRQVLLDYPAVAGVDVHLRTTDGEPIARVSLDRSSLSIYDWDRALAYSSRAQQEGTNQPRRLEELFQWAEDRVDHWYAPLP